MQLIRREGDAERGRAVFFRTGLNSCASCHRVRGQGQWIGPDLSTIGTKYGKDELFRSILNPSAAIGYNYRALILALNDGRVVTGLPVEETPDRLVIKTAEGQRVVIRPGDVEDRKTSDVSLMPEGLAQTLTDTELVDLLEYLMTLREPVSIAGQYHVIGPIDEPNGARTLDPTARIDLSASVRGTNGQVLSWRRLDANAEGLVNLSAMAADGPGQAIYVYTPVTSPVEQKARLVVEHACERDGLAEWQARHLVRPEPTVEVEPAPRSQREFARGHVHPLDPDNRKRRVRGSGHARDHVRFCSARIV